MKNVIFGMLLLFSSSSFAADFTVELIPAAGSVQFSDIANKPAVFPPATHNHAISEITNLQSELNGKASTSAIADMLTRPTLKAMTIQKFTASGNATYTTPTSPAPLYIKVKMVGGGGGGSGGGPAGTSSAGSPGGSSSFGTSLLLANGGGAGPVAYSSTGGGGGSGGYLEAIIPAPFSASYAISVGNGGTAGPAGSSGSPGFSGGSGLIIVEEYYQ